MTTLWDSQQHRICSLFFAESLLTRVFEDDLHTLVCV